MSIYGWKIMQLVFLKSTTYMYHYVHVSRHIQKVLYIKKSFRKNHGIRKLKCSLGFCLLMDFNFNTDGIHLTKGPYWLWLTHTIFLIFRILWTSFIFIFYPYLHIFNRIIIRVCCSNFCFFSFFSCVILHQRLSF